MKNNRTAYPMVHVKHKLGHTTESGYRFSHHMESSYKIDECGTLHVTDLSGNIISSYAHMVWHSVVKEHK